MTGKFIINAAAAVLLASTAAFAQMDAPPSPPDIPHMGWRMHQKSMMMGQFEDGDGAQHHRCLAGIELTDQQRQSIAKAARDHQRNMAAMGQEFAGAKMKLKLLVTDDKFNKAEVEAIAKKIAKFEESKVVARAEMMRTIRDLLTPDQRIHFDRNVLSMEGKAGHKDRHGWKRGGPRHW